MGAGRYVEKETWWCMVQEATTAKKKNFQEMDTVQRL